MPMDGCWMRLERHEPIHRLLGYPEPIQGDMQAECQFASNGVNTGGSNGENEARLADLQKGNHGLATATPD